MRAKMGAAFVALGLLAGAGAPPASRAEEKAACPPEVGLAGAMVVKARDVLRAGGPDGSQSARTRTGDGAPGAGQSPAAPGGGYGGGRTPQGDPSAVAGRTPLLDQGTGTARGLATSAFEVTPWSPEPTDKTLKARAAQARKLTSQARRLCRAGKPEAAKAKAVEAITILDPK